MQASNICYFKSQIIQLITLIENLLNKNGANGICACWQLNSRRNNSIFNGNEMASGDFHEAHVEAEPKRSLDKVDRNRIVMTRILIVLVISLVAAINVCMCAVHWYKFTVITRSSMNFHLNRLTHFDLAFMKSEHGEFGLHIEKNPFRWYGFNMQSSIEYRRPNPHVLY